MQIKVTQAGPGQLKKRPASDQELGFGKLFADHMFLMDYDRTNGWSNARVEPNQPLRLDPAAMVLHYGQGIFEGMKAYRSRDGGVYLFRARDYFNRMNRSALRLCMPEIDPSFAVEALETLLSVDKDWIPSSPGTALYIRPTMIAIEPQLGVRPADTYLFYIITGPVGAYYKEGFNPVRIHVEDRYIRAVEGGLGQAKTMANYAASLLAAEEAKKKGFTQVLWLDAKERRLVEEVGTMNIFFVIGKELITAPLSGTILPGITRDSVIRLAKDWSLDVSERFLTIDELIAAAKDGSLKEVFGTGTATIVSPVGRISYKGEEFRVADGDMGALSRRLYDKIVSIQYGEAEDPHGWRVKVA